MATPTETRLRPVTPNPDEETSERRRDPARPERPAFPERVSRYLVRGEIGRGGMGVVLEAQDPALARPVAL